MHDATHSIRSDRSAIVLWTWIVITALILAGSVFVFVRSRPAPQSGDSGLVNSLPQAGDGTDQRQIEREARLALDCLGSFFSAPNDLMRIAALRPVPNLAETYREYRSEIERLIDADPNPGGNLKRDAGFVGIPIHFPNHLPVTAWVEIRGDTARLDLDSLVGKGDVRWENFAKVEVGRTIFLRGSLVGIDEKDDQLEFIFPDGKQRINVTCERPDDLTGERQARVTLLRTLETALRRTEWRVIQIHGWDWLSRSRPSIKE